MFCIKIQRYVHVQLLVKIISNLYKFKLLFTSKNKSKPLRERVTENPRFWEWLCSIKGWRREYWVNLYKGVSWADSVNRAEILVSPIVKCIFGNLEGNFSLSFIFDICGFTSIAGSESWSPVWRRVTLMARPFWEFLFRKACRLWMLKKAGDPRIKSPPWPPI